mmetsp:Transcript_109547/g.349485  ORF Transcript_109547/g.349485 Transcript_109547/m.349485 type:complete len:201 (-) Transcript_109547:123-725(-)
MSVGAPHDVKYVTVLRCGCTFTPCCSTATSSVSQWNWIASSECPLCRTCAHHSAPDLAWSKLAPSVCCANTALAKRSAKQRGSAPQGIQDEPSKAKTMRHAFANSPHASSVISMRRVRKSKLNPEPASTVLPSAVRSGMHQDLSTRSVAPDMSAFNIFNRNVRLSSSESWDNFASDSFFRRLPGGSEATAAESCSGAHPP